MSDGDKFVARENLSKEIESYKQNNGIKEEQINNIESQMAQIKDFAWKMIDKFGASSFKLSVSSHMQYDETLQFNENNVTLYLSELEEYISNFITYLAQKEKNPDAPVSALSLGEMVNKEFDKKAINIDNIP